MCTKLVRETSCAKICAAKTCARTHGHTMSAEDPNTVGQAAKCFTSFQLVGTCQKYVPKSRKISPQDGFLVIVFVAMILVAMKPTSRK